MRQRVPKLVISFESSTAAMVMESAARPGLGRIIPLPAKISAGCGLAFCTDLQDEEEIVKVLEECGIAYSGIHIIELYETRT